MKVITDSNKIESLLTRRVVDALVVESLRAKLASGRKLRVKFGADPSSPDLHLGHAVVLKKLKEFQDLGHQIVFIIGDYTAMVGDPSGKSKTRPMLTVAEAKQNAETYFKQAGRIIDIKKTEIHRNSEWFADMEFNDVIRLAANFTVARMIEREVFHQRLKEGTDVHLHELLYPAMQAYDSIMVKADVEIGGTDQRFNILAGRDLQRKLGQVEQDCLFLGPILVGTDGVKKMSKSLGNYVGLTDAPDEMFGKTMSIPDTALWDWFALATDVSEAEIAAMRAACVKGEMNPRDAKVRLAKAIISEYHSPADADAAEENFRKLFQKKEVPDDVREVQLTTRERSLAEILVECGLAESKSEARRLVEQNGIKLDGEVVNNPQRTVAPTEKGILIQKGKRFFVRVIGR
jgi:tyrosyl-tRNA synthetase